ncbi:hypothetical protein LPJCHP_LPJCHP_11940, partial [Dysosmobacter welbionis]
VAEGSAAGVSGGAAGPDGVGVPPAALYCQGAQEPAAVPRDADDLRHRYPGERTALHHGGGPACWPDGDPA